MKTTIIDGAKGITFGKEIEYSKSKVMKDLAVKVSGRHKSKVKMRINITERIKGL